MRMDIALLLLCIYGVLKLRSNRIALEALAKELANARWEMGRLARSVRDFRE